MSGRREDDFGAIAWPGFVDILSAVIIMFVFFVMITASALYFHILIFKSKIESETVDSLSKRTEVEELFQATDKNSMKVKVEEMSQQMQVLEKVIAEFGRIDLLLNNASVWVSSPFLEMSRAEWDAALEINLTGPFLCSQAVAPHMLKQQSGLIINITVLSAFQT